MLYRHKNFGNRMVRINDSTWKTYDLLPGDEVIIDKPSPKYDVKVIEEVIHYSEKKKSKKIKDKLKEE